ncbi:MAG: AhpC/TSA family protein [Candidatus Pseudobacter hemicellulosilyticus]|uniref:AhpC/TSA family protein n=1 Tax=Candidatus Pseudobacter hemicellulosilyticus TaxID=3121375 RepID=A0AAJ6BFH7_9BACT|nr:MAG: AhpC/TSA family protein [Pseudobacter sp.]
MIRNSFLMAAALLTVQQVTAQTGKPFRIAGKITGNYSGKLYMSYQSDEDKYATDSAQVSNGTFKFAGQLQHPVEAMVYINQYKAYNEPGNALRLYIEPTNMALQLDPASLEKGVLTGSATEQESKKLEAAMASANEQLRPLNKEYNQLNGQYIEARRNKDSATMQSISNRMEALKDKMSPFQDEREQKIIAFVKANPASYVSAASMRWLVSSLPLGESEQIYAAMPENVKQSSYGKTIAKELKGLRGGSPGATAHVFSKTDINGQPFSLADLKGKYVLVDFWASWCVPCRKGNPHLKSLYAKYKDKGLEIVGISDDDRNNEAWKKAVEKDGIGIWKHVLRGLDMDKRMKNEPNPEDISDYYGIHSLPTKILIDPNGVIIGRYGGGGENDEAMDKKLAEVFKS